MSKVIVFATPVFFLLIAIELAWGRFKGRNTYTLSDTINSIGLGMLSQLTGVFMRLLRVGLYAAVFSSVALWRNDAFWMSWAGWLVALVFYDLCYYWLHRLGHESAVLWAAHVVHHQSQSYNLSTALRQTSSGALLGWVFYLPMALAGVPPLVFGTVALIDLLYQFWVHTEYVPKLGWFDRWFCSPSNHRVHHAVNEQYLDRNYGGILIIWDRIFGSFEEEGEPCVYGTRKPLNSWDPLWANAEVYWTLLQASWQAPGWGDKLRVWFKPPGWQSAQMAAAAPQQPFDLKQVQTFDPPTPRKVQWFALAQFVALLGGVTGFLWVADSTPLSDMAVWLAVLCAGLWAVGAVLQGRISPLQALIIESAALTTAFAALDMTEEHRIFKPLTLLLALLFVAFEGHSAKAALPMSRSRQLLLAALACSLAGDVLLMFPGHFVPGLLAFLVGHLFYIALFRQGVNWFPSPRALACTLGYGAAMYGFLFAFLPAGLRLPVAAYVLVIALMAAQAIGRAAVLQSRASWWVATGALLFMASDSLLAINRFAVPLAVWDIVASFWILATYYTAQILIATNALISSAPAQIHSENRAPSAFGGATPR